jgi:PilZ domain
MTKPIRERRKSPRIPAKLAMQVAGQDDASVLTTESINLSASGIQFGSRVFLSPLTKVALTLLLPPFGRRLRRERMLRCEGIIVRCEETPTARQKPRYELACYFTGLEEVDRELIEQYVVWRSIRRLPSAAPESAGTKTRRRSAAP